MKLEILYRFGQVLVSSEINGLATLAVAARDSIVVNHVMIPPHYFFFSE